MSFDSEGPSNWLQWLIAIVPICGWAFNKLVGNAAPQVRTAAVPDDF